MPEKEEKRKTVPLTKTDMKVLEKIKNIFEEITNPKDDFQNDKNKNQNEA